MRKFYAHVKQQPAWLALFIFLLVCLWLLSGTSSDKQKVSSEPLKQAQQRVATVRVKRIDAEQVSREIVLYGRTEPYRVTSLRAEVAGKITAIHIEEGVPVKKGQVILTIDERDLSEQLRAAEAVLRQREVELKATSSLLQQGYQSEVLNEQAKAALNQAKANLARLQLQLQHTTVLAPYDGVLNQRFVEEGHSVKDGDKLLDVVDLSPLVIRAHVSESDIEHIHLQQPANGTLLSGQKVEGYVQYISSVSEPGTNTFAIEVAIPNSENTLKAGLSTELVIPLETTWAIKITPASMALDKNGNIGVKTVVDGEVRFTPVDIVKSDESGVWLAGLGQSAQVITFGHGYVNAGDKVNATLVEGEI